MLIRGILFFFAIMLLKVSQSEIARSGLNARIFSSIMLSRLYVSGVSLRAFLKSVRRLRTVFFLKASSNPSMVCTFLKRGLR